MCPTNDNADDSAQQVLLPANEGLGLYTCACFACTRKEAEQNLFQTAIHSTLVKRAPDFLLDKNTIAVMPDRQPIQNRLAGW